MQSRRLNIYVEAETDRRIVAELLIAGDLSEGVQIFPCGGKRAVRERIANLRDTAERNHLALVDSDNASVADSMVLAREQLGFPSIPVFCAVPTIEAWLFADDLAAREAARSPQALALLERLPLPEMIAYPKQLAWNVFDKGSNFEFMRGVNVAVASARSPSLRIFLEGVSHAHGRLEPLSVKALHASVSRDALSTLLRELPGDTVAWKTVDGAQVRAEDLAQQVLEGTELGKQYVTEVLRIARDIIVRKATR